MADLNRIMPRIDASRFSMVPRADIPRSSFTTTHSHKTTFHTNYLIPILIDEVLPADVHQGNVTIFARLATPLFPIMDRLELETFFFFVPNRLVWDNWKKMMGERRNPLDSISYTTPLIESPAHGFPVLGVYDYLGLPTLGQLAPGDVIRCNALPLRGYNFIWNEWFRDQNLQDSLIEHKGNGPDPYTDYILTVRNKRHDYFTSALPWPLKGGGDISIPMGGSAPVHGIAFDYASVNVTGGPPPPTAYQTHPGGGPGALTTGWAAYMPTNIAGNVWLEATDTTNPRPNIYADLSTATGVAINALRLAVQTQKLLERDARSGTRYTEILRAHFGVEPEDSRLQRPEYIGGGRTDIQTQAIAQTSATDISGSTSPLGALGAAATATDQHSYSYNATEHGFILGLANVRAELTYQQGRHRLWTRETRYDHYWTAFAHLGEQIIRNDEIYAQGDVGVGMSTGINAQAFGYQERWAEYRHRKSYITGLFRSTTTGNIDEWHLAQEFTALPALNNLFIRESVPLERVLAAGPGADSMQILFDSVFRIKTTRAMPMFSVPGMMDRF